MHAFLQLLTDEHSDARIGYLSLTAGQMRKYLHTANRITRLCKRLRNDPQAHAGVTEVNMHDRAMQVYESRVLEDAGLDPDVLDVDTLYELGTRRITLNQDARVGLASSICEYDVATNGTVESIRWCLHEGHAEDHPIYSETIALVEIATALAQLDALLGETGHG